MSKRSNEIFIIRRLLKANQDILDNVPFRVSGKNGQLIVVAYMITREKALKLQAELVKAGYKCSIDCNFHIHVSRYE